MVVRDRDDFLALLVFVAAVAKPIPTILQDVRAIYKTRNHLTLQRHLQNMFFYHKGLGVRKTPLPLVAGARKAAILRGNI